MVVTLYPTSHTPNDPKPNIPQTMVTLNPISHTPNVPQTMVTL